jgi:capsular polysaccharide biosynthesis protein
MQWKQLKQLNVLFATKTCTKKQLLFLVNILSILFVLTNGWITILLVQSVEESFIRILIHEEEDEEEGIPLLPVFS